MAIRRILTSHSYHRFAFDTSHIPELTVLNPGSSSSLIHFSDTGNSPSREWCIDGTEIGGSDPIPRVLAPDQLRFTTFTVACEDFHDEEMPISVEPFLIVGFGGSTKGSVRDSSYSGRAVESKSANGHSRATANFRV